MDKVKQFVKNKRGITIVKCCMSCKHRDCGSDDKTRYCKKYDAFFSKHNLCKFGWELDPNLENAGIGGGRVQSKDYIDYHRKHPASTADDYEKEYGSKYLNNI